MHIGQHAYTHAECRSRVCCICWNRSGKKIILVLEGGTDFEESVKRFVDPDFSADALKYSVSNNPPQPIRFQF